MLIEEDMSFQLSGIWCSGWEEHPTQPGTVNRNVLESDVVPLWDGTVSCRSLNNLRLLKGL